MAQVVLARLLAELPAGARESSLIVECKARDLLDAIDADIDLRSNLRDPAAALESALLYMHENRVVELDRGRSVFRSAMTILTDPVALKRRFGKDDFSPLQDFYRERRDLSHAGCAHQERIGRRPQRDLDHADEPADRGSSPSHRDDVG